MSATLIDLHDDDPLKAHVYQCPDGHTFIDVDVDRTVTVRCHPAMAEELAERFAKSAAQARMLEAQHAQKAVA